VLGAGCWVLGAGFPVPAMGARLGEGRLKSRLQRPEVRLRGLARTHPRDGRTPYLSIVTSPRGREQ
ncbi:MAG TPA: hypothetical protein VFJ16_03220, partial [Longimicrobium sp.]|nr:hypothetical protein [Longimicrobium sp.]